MRITKKLILLTLGIILIIIGILGTILPVIPGIIPLIIGLVLVSKSSRRIENYRPLKATLGKLREERTKIAKNLPDKIRKIINLL